MLAAIKFFNSLGVFLGKYWKPIAAVLIVSALVWSAYNQGQYVATNEIKVEQLTNVVEIKSEQQKALASAPRSVDGIVDSLQLGSF